VRRFLHAVLSALRKNIGAGLLVFVPVALTIWLVTVVWTWLDSPIRALFREPPPGATGLWAAVARALVRVTAGGITVLDRPGVGLFVLFAAIYVLGLLTRTFLGRGLVAIGEAIVRRLPLVRNIYTGTKQILAAVLAGGQGSFRDAVLFEYPRKGIYAIGFVTSASRGEIQDRTREDTVNVFLPTTPNPTSGFLLMVPRGDLTYLEMTVEDAVKLIISGGIVAPDETKAVRVTNPPAEDAPGAKASPKELAGPSEEQPDDGTEQGG